MLIHRAAVCLVAAALAGCLQQGQPPGRPAAVDGAAGAATVEGTPPAVRLAALDAPRPQRVAAGRDPFRFAAPEAAGEPGAAVRVPRGAGPAPQVEPPPPAAAGRAAAASLRFIALTEDLRRSGRIAVLSVDGRVVQGRSGDTLDDGSIRVLRIAADSVEIEFTETEERQVLRLDGS